MTCSSKDSRHRGERLQPFTPITPSKTLELTMSYLSCSTPRMKLWLGVTALTLTLTLCGWPEPSAWAQTGTPPPQQTMAPTAAPTGSAASASVPAATSPVLTPATELPMLRPPAGDYADNPYGLRALWGQGDLVARATLLILLIMSLASWYVLVRKLIEQRRTAIQARAATKAFANVETLKRGAEALDKKSPFRFIVDSSLESIRQHEAVADQVDMNTWAAQAIERAVATVQNRSQDGLAVLATVGATAPFVGLFGTVWGIYNALVRIGASGQASIDKVAGPVGEALIMTAIGLAVAVPAVLGYNWLVRRNRVAMEHVRGFSSDLHTIVLAAVGKSRRNATEHRET